MPDLSDVENLLVSLVTQIVYPNGTAADSATSDPIKVFRGWPIPANLDADLKANIVNVSVFPLDMEQNVTRYAPEWMELPSPAITLTMPVSGQTVTISGRPCCPLNAAVLVDGKAFVHPLQVRDTLNSIATALAAQIGVYTQASSSGAVITIPAAKTLETRIGAVGSVVQEIKRQKKSFRITIWCNNPLVRDSIAKVIDPALASLTDIAMIDGTAGRIRYERTHPEDGAQKTRLYRRDLVYSVEYGTTITQRAADVVGGVIKLAGGLDTASPDLETINV